MSVYFERTARPKCSVSTIRVLNRSTIELGKLTEAFKRRNCRSSIQRPIPIIKRFGIGAMFVEDSNHHALNGSILFGWKGFIG